MQQLLLPKIKFLIIPLFLAAVLAMLPGCNGKQSPQDIKQSLSISNVAIILIDTLRADHLSVYGYQKETAPKIAELGKNGVVFENAFSVSSTTAPSVASIFTGLYPSRHGVITGIIATKHLVKEDPNITLNRIPDALTTLGEVFKQSNYGTYGVADNLNISSQLGFTQGFDKFETYRYKTAETVNKLAKDWHKDITQSGKYLFYVHYMDPHKPYNKREPWFEKSKDKKQREINAYDSEIRFTDEHLTELYDLYGWDKNTLVVILADHGEEFWDHGKDGHGKSLYTEVIKVPFIFHHPALRAARISEEVSTMDLLPTLAGLLGLQKDPLWQGKDLSGLILGEQTGTSSDRPIFQELLRRPEHPQAVKRSVIEESWHFIANEPKNAKASEELYHLPSDLPEKLNLINADKQRELKLRQNITDLKNGKTAVPVQEIKIPVNKEQLEELKSLGYIQ